MALTPLHVRDVCYGGSSWWGGGGSSGLCKYLENATRSDGQWVQLCTKLNPGAYANLQKKQGQYAGTGDNCAGYLYLHYKQQGYDV